MARGKDIFSPWHIGKSKKSLRIRDFGAARIRRVGSIGRIRRIYGNGRARKRLSGDGINDFAADSKRGWRGRSRRRSGLLKKGHQKKKREEFVEKHAGYSPIFTNSRSIFAD